MPAPKKLPDFDTLRELVKQGLTDAEIGQRYNTTGEAVRQARMRAEPPIERPDDKAGHKQYIPWAIRGVHRGDAIAKRLTWYSLRQQGRPINTRNGDRLLDEWLAYMDGLNPWGVPLSVHYSPTDPDGFWLEPRRDGDRHYIHPPEKTSGTRSRTQACLV